MNQDFIRSTLSLRGKEEGQKWLGSIPKLVEKYETEWSLKSEGVFSDLSINYVEKVVLDSGEKSVLKIGFPDAESLREIKSLLAYKGNGAVKVLSHSLEDFVYLLERCIPGDPLHTLNNEEKEILIFAEVCKKIWIKDPQDHVFQKLSDEIKYFDWYFEHYEKSKNFLPKELVVKAREKFEYLISTQKEKYLLHSDLHHDNILLSQRGWLAIDPKGLIGEREYEAGVYILNPYKRFKENEELISQDFFAKRIELISKALNFDRRRVADWAFVKQILSLIWSIQDYSSGDSFGLRNARELEKLI